MCGSIDDIRREAIEIIRTDYPKIKAGMFRLEVFMHARSKKAVYELRDFLDHFAALFQDGIALEEATKHLFECRTHLRRCTVEPLEYMAEKGFVRLDRYSRWSARIPFLFAFRDNPVSKPEFFQRMKEAKEHIANGRHVKTEGQACEHMESAVEIVTDLLEQLKPSRYFIQGLLWVCGIIFLTFIGTFAAVRLTPPPEIKLIAPSPATANLRPSGTSATSPAPSNSQRDQNTP